MEENTFHKSHINILSTMMLIIMNNASGMTTFRFGGESERVETTSETKRGTENSC